MNFEISAAIQAATQTGLRDTIELTDWLYQNCYIHSYGTPLPAIPAADLTATLQQSNRTRNTADHGWQAVELLPNGELAARKRGIIRRFAPGSYLSAERGPSSPPEKDDPVSIYFKKESLLTQPGNYFVFSETLGAEPEWSTLYRFYWHIAPEGAPALVEAVTDECNAFQLPFRFKCPRQAASYSRRDAAVLYIAQHHTHLLLPILERIRRRVEPWLRPSAPLFTRPLSPGLAFAENPPGPDSFGMHRCRLLAEAILQHGGNLERCFLDAGLSLEKPWLNPGSEDLPWPPEAMPAAGPRSTRGGFLDTAARMGAHLCRDAIWHGGQCTWTSDEEITKDQIIHKALPANLYRGAAGVAIFLSRLATPTGEPLFQRTAEAAMRYALALPAGDFSNGFYSGKPGILLAAAEILGETNESEFLATCRPHHGQFDLMSGCAGAIAALLSLHRDRRSPALLHQAERNGDWLLAQANPIYNLTGFSHGAAGFAWVFAELYAATQQPRFAQAAHDAIRYERHHFSPSENNWPDLRINPPRFCSMWCHGAGGIGLSRLGIAELLAHDPLFQQECDTAWRALEATRFPNWCLCHGVAGNADILLSAGRREWALAQAHQGIEQFEATGRPWPCDSAPAGETPGLMTGTAGIGYFYLRAAIAETPSVLLWR
ncbi:MAG: lanthionine synthetase LanC family protein [Bryobacteraceae bacterium]